MITFLWPCVFPRRSFSSLFPDSQTFAPHLLPVPQESTFHQCLHSKPSFSLLPIETNLFSFTTQRVLFYESPLCLLGPPIPDGSCSKARTILFSYSVCLLLSKSLGALPICRAQLHSVGARGLLASRVLHCLNACEGKGREHRVLYGGDKNPSSIRHVVLSYLIIQT